MMYNWKVKSIMHNGKIWTKRKLTPEQQEELLDTLYSKIVHEFDKVYYLWFVITFNDKLRRK